MKPRSKSRTRWERTFAHALQLWRLEQIACGAEKPLCTREEFFLQTLQDFGRANPNDFILPLPLLVWEGVTEVLPPDERSDEPEPEH